ncbi:MAG: aminotransferase class V-fold PLP-dependent enzyme [Solirubrobacteraceae bacterium]
MPRLSAEFDPAGCYLDSATYGLPPRAAVAALHEVTQQWAVGNYDPGAAEDAIARARASFARLHGVGAGEVAIGHQVSPLVAAIAAGLPRGARVLTAEGDFSSLLFPFAAAAAGADVRATGLDALAGSIDSRTDVVAVSAVQSADGRVADLEAIGSAAAAHGALTVVDATQASGWLPLDTAPFDVLVSGAYKWLSSPRGTALMAIRPQALERLRPISAGWYAAPQPWEACYGLPLRLAANARRLDVSPAWLSWHATAASLELLQDVGIQRIYDHDVALANRLRCGLRLPATDSAIVSTDADPDAAQRLAGAGVRVSVRAGRVRISPHLYNDEADIDRALEALAFDRPLATAHFGSVHEQPVAEMAG